MPATNVLAIAGAKGGVGKTTTSINLGAALTEAGADVAIVEADLAMANVADFISVGDSADLHDVLTGNANVADATYETPAGTVLPSGMDLSGFADANVDELADVVAELRDRHDLVLLDTGAGVSYESVLPLAIADATILVSTPRVAAVRDASKTAELVDRVEGNVLGIVFTKSGTGSTPPVERISEFVGADLLGHVGDDPAIPTSQDRRRPVVTEAPDSAAASAYESIAGKVARRLGSLPAAGPRPAVAVDRARRFVSEHHSSGFDGDHDPGSGFEFLRDGDLVGDERTEEESEELSLP